MPEGDTGDATVEWVIHTDEQAYAACEAGNFQGALDTWLQIVNSEHALATVSTSHEALSELYWNVAAMYWETGDETTAKSYLSAAGHSADEFEKAAAAAAEEAGS